MLFGPRPLTDRALIFAAAVPALTQASIVRMARFFPAGALRLDT